MRGNASNASGGLLKSGAVAGDAAAADFARAGVFAKPLNLFELFLGDEAAWDAFGGLVDEPLAVVVVGFVRNPRGVVADVAGPFDIAAVDNGEDLAFFAFGIFAPPTELNTHGRECREGLGGGEGKRGQLSSEVKSGGAVFDAADGEMRGGEIDGVAAKWGAKGAGIDDGHAGGRAFDPGPMDVAGKDETGVGAMLLSERRGEGGVGAPST